MADIADRANRHTEIWLAEALAAREEAAAQTPGHSALYCRECGERIPAARRNAVPGCQLCIECQEELEIYGDEL
jgi:phage/conjugal plasmid C-4 type zinc finger TraR family protein